MVRSSYRRLWGRRNRPKEQSKSNGGSAREREIYPGPQGCHPEDARLRVSLFANGCGEGRIQWPNRVGGKRGGLRPGRPFASPPVLRLVVQGCGWPSAVRDGAEDRPGGRRAQGGAGVSHQPAVKMNRGPASPLISPPHPPPLLQTTGITPILWDFPPPPGRPDIIGERHGLRD